VFEIDFDADGFADGLTRFEAELESLMPQVLETALQAIAATARELAPVGETEHLRESIQPLPITGSWSAGNLAGEVEAGAPYALAVEEGSAAHEIRARFRRALRFPAAEGFAFARSVQHPGAPPHPFLEPALRAEESAFLAEASAAVDLALHRAGF
jgi:hypothetical protein